MTTLGSVCLLIGSLAAAQTLSMVVERLPPVIVTVEYQAGNRSGTAEVQLVSDSVRDTGVRMRLELFGGSEGPFVETEPIRTR